MSGGSEWLFSVGATLGGTNGAAGGRGDEVCALVHGGTSGIGELPMSQAPQAHRVMAAGEHVGKILQLAT
jgi:hypothetical protein